MGYSRRGEPGLHLTRKADMACPRVEQCGYRCGAGKGDHDGPCLFEEHKHPGRPPQVREPLARLETFFGGDATAHFANWRAAVDSDLARGLQFSMHPSAMLVLLDVLDAVRSVGKPEEGS